MRPDEKTHVERKVRKLPSGAILHFNQGGGSICGLPRPNAFAPESEATCRRCRAALWRARRLQQLAEQAKP